MPTGKGYGYSQSKMDRKHESMGMKNHNMKYMKGEMGVMGHDKMPKKTNVFAAQKRDIGRVQMKPMDYRGSPDDAFDYNY